MTCLGLIPARGGSKRFPGKNRALLDGKPLIAWTIESVIESGVCDSIVFSSDDKALLTIAGEYGEIETDVRDPSLAGDLATTADVLLDLIKKKAEKGVACDRCGIFLPTCPFRTPADIKGAALLLDEQADSVISFKESQEIPEFMFRKAGDDFLLPVFGESKIFSGKTRFQEYDTVYSPNGAIYLGWVDRFLQNKTFYTNKIKAYVMPGHRSLDIDYPEDLAYAEFMLKHTNHKLMGEDDEG